MNLPLSRAFDFTITRSEPSNGGLILEGYAAVFGETIRVWDPWEGEYDERFSFGAFKRTLQARTPYMMFNHGKHPLFGSLPLGVYTDFREDKRGLFVRGELHASSFFEPVREAIASGSVSGMSVMFEPVRDSRDESGDVPLIIREEVKLLEAGPVVMPAYQSTTVGVRMLNDMRMLTINDLNPATSPEPDHEVTSDEEPGDQPADERATDTEPVSTPQSVLDALARCVARRYPPS